MSSTDRSPPPPRGGRAARAARDRLLAMQNSEHTALPTLGGGESVPTQITERISKRTEPEQASAPAPSIKPKPAPRRKRVATTTHAHEQEPLKAKPKAKRTPRVRKPKVDKDIPVTTDTSTTGPYAATLGDIMTFINTRDREGALETDRGVDDLDRLPIAAILPAPRQHTDVTIPVREENYRWFERLAELADIDTSTLQYRRYYDYESLVRRIRALTAGAVVMDLVAYGDFLAEIIIAYIERTDDIKVLRQAYWEALSISSPIPGHPGAKRVLAALSQRIPWEEIVKIPDTILAATQGGDIEVLSYALDAQGISTAIPRVTNLTPAQQDLLNEALVYAVAGGSEDAIIMLLRIGADPNVDSGALFIDVMDKGLSEAAGAFIEAGVVH